MNGLFLLTGATQRDPVVEAWLDLDKSELGMLARTWFTQLRKCGKDVRELLHDDCPVACVGAAAFAYVNVFKAHVNVGFYHGAELADPTGLLEGSGKRMRHVKLKPGVKLNTAALTALINAAYADVKVRLDAARADN